MNCILNWGFFEIKWTKIKLIQLVDDSLPIEILQISILIKFVFS